MNQEKGTSLWPWIAIFAGAGAVVTILWLISWALITRQLGNPMSLGPFGDMFGAVNALFSGYAFAGIIVDILMQRQELKSQREEAARSTKAQQGLGTAAAIEAQYHMMPTLNPTTSRFITIIGDSVTAGFGGSDKSERWPTILAKEHNLIVHDISQMGETTASALKRAKGQTITSPVVILEIGGNDLLGSP